MAEAETVDVLELEIKAKAERAASEISSLAASVADFGKNVRRYINNLNDFGSALTAIAEKAIRLRSGARGLRAIIEEAMMDTMFDLPSRKEINRCVITRDVIEKGEKPILTLGERKYPATPAKKKVPRAQTASAVQ